eukprot:GGOE01003801.1.p2 GENE.GGOE01003801.1~~GGOE01003801.1.p2  ORF type:complete len:155 (-),score=21.61 GGOE01003801.1:105-569(-)
MATLDNFNTGNSGTMPLHTTYADRMAMVQTGLHSSRPGSEWDLGSRVPLAPVQPYDPGVRRSAHADPQLEETLTQRGMKDRYCPLTPRPERRIGDTAEGILLYDNPRRTVRHQLTRLRDRLTEWFPPLAGVAGGARGINQADVRSYPAFHPYRR